MTFEDKPDTGKAREQEDRKEVAPISEICANSENLAAELVDDESEIEPTEGFFFTSQRWH